MNTMDDSARLQVRAGALLFLLWGVLHVWVGLSGLDAYLNQGLIAQWNMLIGGEQVPRATFVHVLKQPTALAQAQLLVNFCLDVGGYGVLALYVAWELWTRPGWRPYMVGLIVIGLGDLAFLFSLVTPGVIELSFGVILGPVLWALAVIVTPWGLANRFRRDWQDGQGANGSP